MSTNSRPFFSSFLSAFRARSGVQKASSSTTGGGVSGASLSSVYKAAAAQQQKAQVHGQAIPQSGGTPTGSNTSQTQLATSLTKTGTNGHLKETATGTSPPAASAFGGARHHQPRTHHTHTIPRHIAAPRQSTPSPPMSRSPGQSANTPTAHGPFASSGFSSPQRQRRESDSSSDGFREVMGSEKWYIGGRTAAGEEKFYKLGLVKRPRSLDRVSLDRISL
jgi:hypothetical protein